MDKKLIQKITKMVKVDQAMRKSGKWDARVDKNNTAQVKLIIKKYGWPSKSLIGEKGVEGFWLLVQHADHDLKFQKVCLELLREAVDKKESKKEHLAYLTDRIMVREKGSQLYGTQFKIDKKTNTLVLYEIEDPKNFSRRRKKMNLIPFREYKRMAVASFKKFS